MKDVEDTNEAISVCRRTTFQGLKQEVGEEAILHVGQDQRNLAGSGGGDDNSANSLRESVKSLLVETCLDVGERVECLQFPRSGRVAGVEKDNEPLGPNLLEEGRQLLTSIAVSRKRPGLQSKGIRKVPASGPISFIPPCPEKKKTAVSSGPVV